MNSKYWEKVMKEKSYIDQEEETLLNAIKKKNRKGLNDYFEALEDVRTW